MHGDESIREEMGMLNDPTDLSSSSSSSSSSGKSLAQMISSLRTCTTNATSLIASNDVNYTIKLIQHTPAWALHALLRFKGIPYVVMNCEFSCALSRPLPLIVDGNYALSETAAFEHIIESCSCSLSHAEKMLCTYIESRLIHGLKYLKFLLSRRGSAGTSVYEEWSVSELFYASEPKALQYMFDRSHHANMNQQEVIDDIEGCYEYVESLISDSCCIVAPGFVPNKFTKFPSLLEAVLFGHIAGI